MLTLRTRCQQRANMENDPSISTAEWNALISEIYGELWEEVADSGLRYFERETTLTTTGVAYLSEPTDQLAMVDNLEYVIDTVSGRCRRLYLLQPQERSALAGRTGDPCRFEMVDDRFYLYPTPPTGKSITLRYIPQATDLSAYADGDVVDVVTAAGEAMLIWGVAAIAKHKDDRFVDYAEAQKEKARLRLQQWARNRAFNETPRRIVEDDHGELEGDWTDGYFA
jgi:hypothetical protein